MTMLDTMPAFDLRSAHSALTSAVGADLQGATANLWADSLHWRGCAPFDEQKDPQTVLDVFWRDFVDAFPDVRRRHDILLAGDSAGTQWWAACGTFVATFDKAWLGIPPTGKLTVIRFGEFNRVEDGRIVETLFLPDLIDLMRQARVNPLPPARGAEGLYVGPAGGDGIRLGAEEPGETRHTREIVESMLAGLLSYDGVRLESMKQERFWWNDMLWYGPAGIGATHGLRGFQVGHQRPFLQAFPDRRAIRHEARLASGPYFATCGWPSLQATHTGGGWLGLAPTNKEVTMRVMDFWRRDQNWLAENWVFIDIIDVFRQLGYDLLDRVRAMSAPQ